jgi:hypothetical protein
MWGLITLAVSFAVSWVGYGAARRFVRERLRYVEAAQRPSSAVIAGFVAMLIAIPVISVLHWIPILGWLVGGGTALVFGLSVGLGVHSGALDVKRGYVIGPGA